MLLLTPLGEQKATNVEGRGADFAVLSLLYEVGGPVEFEEVVDHLKTDEVKASMIVRRLMNQGYIKET